MPHRPGKRERCRELSVGLDLNCSGQKPQIVLAERSLEESFGLLRLCEVYLHNERADEGFRS